MKCEFCGNILDPKQDRCKYCGAPCLSGHSERIDLEQHDTALKSSAEEKRDENLQQKIHHQTAGKGV